MSLIFILPVIMGIFIASQTAINSRLSHYTRLPLFSSTISFAIGAIFLFIICLIERIPLGISQLIFTTTPWWAWIDQFGWFDSPLQKMNLLNISGAVLLLVGLVIFVDLQAMLSNH